MRRPWTLLTKVEGAKPVEHSSRAICYGPPAATGLDGERFGLGDRRSVSWEEGCVFERKR